MLLFVFLFVWNKISWSTNIFFNEDEHEVTSRRLLTNTMVVYQRYLSLLANIQQDTIGSTTPNPFKPVNPFTRKFCRYCDASGKWSEIESCVSLSCDPAILTGSPDFIFANNQSNVVVAGTKQQYNLFKPFSVLAVYSFGSEKSRFHILSSFKNNKR